MGVTLPVGSVPGRGLLDGCRASTRSDRVRALQNVLKSFNTAPPGRPGVETPETRERLRSLGYIGGGSAAPRDTYTEADDPKRLIELEQAIERAMEAYQQGRAGEAVAALRDVIARRPDTEDAYRRLALIYWRAGDARAAIGTLEAALKNGITQSEVKIKLGQYLALAGQPARAIALLETFTEVDPDALIALGNAYVAAGEPMPSGHSGGSSRRTRKTASPTRTSAWCTCRRASTARPRPSSVARSISIPGSPAPTPRWEWSSPRRGATRPSMSGSGRWTSAPPTMPDRDQIRKILDAIR